MFGKHVIFTEPCPVSENFLKRAVLDFSLSDEDIIDTGEIDRYYKSPIINVNFYKFNFPALLEPVVKYLAFPIKFGVI